MASAMINLSRTVASRRTITPPIAVKRLFTTDPDPESSPADLEKLSANLRSRQLPLIYDDFSTMSSQLLFSTIADFLPKLQGHYSRPESKYSLRPGHHLVYFRPPVKQRDLLPDGTDSLHAPGGAWTQRLWAGGKVRFPQKSGIVLNSQRHVLNETISDVRISGRQGAEKIFVNIRRVVGTHSPGQSQSIARHRLSQDNVHFMKNALVIEDRELCFLREEPEGTLRSLMKPRPAITPPLNADFSHSLVPTPALLFRFSALTFNAHAIHIDPEYTRNVYGLPNLVVHGPLSLVLMLECMLRALERHELKNNQQPHIVVEIEYKNLMPLFVNEEMTICCKRDTVSSSKQDSLSGKAGETWSVWIQKAQGDQQTVAVRGTVLVEPFEDRKRKPSLEKKDASAIIGEDSSPVATP
jgi:hydroxyacyl-ACP dehydratase HTD2-like protein with hotdog domain